MRSTKYSEQQNKLHDFKKLDLEFNIVYSKTIQCMLKKLNGSYHFLSILKFDIWKQDH